MTQLPETGDFLLKWRGDTLEVTLKLERPRKGRAAFRTNIGHAKVRRREIIAETERGETPLAKAWTDIPLNEVEPGLFKASIPLDEVGVFSGKACFFPEGSNVPEWPEGENTHVKVESAVVRENNSIYTVFPRQFGSFREVARRLDFIMGKMGFRIIQTLPPFPVPTTYAVMGEYGCPFAARDFFSVDAAMAEFDEFSTPLDQFKELIDAVHARKGLFFVDLPANHTGWASTLQTHHPDWFVHEADGRFHSPGAWGVKWADLVELDYSNSELRAYMAEVFLFWCRNGVDGFRCDAGYMIPKDTWSYIVARVREEYPDTIFMLEGLGGELKVTDRLLAESNLDWAYSEIFQTYDRGAFEWYLPGAIARSEKYGTLVHFAETHDNDRLAKNGATYAKLRVQLAALLSWQGAWGIANGVEWLATEKIDVHGRNDLNWGAKDNMVELISALNRLLRQHPAFSSASHLEVITRGDGNTLAVLRKAANNAPEESLLILANLDCHNSVTIDWNRTKYSFPDVITLNPGEVRVLGDLNLEKTANSEKTSTTDSNSAQFHWQYPRDLKRIVCVPDGALVAIDSPHPFRFELVSPRSGKTIRFGRAESHLEFTAPHYHGDGTISRKLIMKLTVYENGAAKRTESEFLIPPTPDKAKVKLVLSGAEVRANPDYRAILSNGAGAAAQVRLGFGRIASQYDAFLAVNPNENAPSDRLNLWARTRIWLQREGYTREFDAKVITSVTVDPAGKGVKWDFRVPCGMGHETAFAISLSLAEGVNAARLKVERYDSGANDVHDQVRLVFRPDIEHRSYHATTKAYQGAEEYFLKGGDPDFRFLLNNCVMHEEPQWEYNVAHPEEAARGQEPSGDLYSPGWISADLKVGETMEIVGAWKTGKKTLRWGIEQYPALSTLPIGEAMKQALELYIVKRDQLKTVIAGYPWFLDWGRDTFIFMRGMIAAGKIADSVKILKAFAAFEENGTLPNIIYGDTAGNRDTTDAQLWFIRCVQEISELKGVKVEGLKSLKATCESIVDHYLKGTPNGIKVDAESALVWSPSHFTWMDTNYPACTPRHGYPIEIQALWISALKFLGREELAARALDSVKRYFKLERGYADCLDAPRGELAADARVDGANRPNQLFLLTLGVLDDPSILEATEELLVPGGVRSLASGHPLYRGVYAGDEDTCRKPAYHNGTVWAWPFPLYAEALVKTGRATKFTALSLLSSAVENLNRGAITHISENADGDAPHVQKGCTAQAWSDSELLRVWLQLGGE